MSSSDELSAPMAGLSVSENSGSPPGTPPRNQDDLPAPNAPGRKRKAPSSWTEERKHKARSIGQKFARRMGGLTGNAPEMGGSRRRRRRSKRRKSRRKRKTKRKKRRKSRKRRKTRRRRRRR